MSVLAFIILGSIIRQINLLVLLSGLMIAPFFFNWRISVKMLERLLITRRLPDWAHAATPFSVRWKIENRRRRIPSWGIRVVDRVNHARSEDRFAESVSVLAPPVPPGSSVDVAWRCYLPERGLYEFGPAEASSGFPVGLVRSKIHAREKQILAVAPRLGKLTRSWSMFLKSGQSGDTSQQRQRSVNDGEFFALRPWSSGDNPRQVHWRSSARHGELMVRQFERQTESRLVLLLDLFDSRLAATDVDFALSFFATVVDRSSRWRNKPGIGIYGTVQRNVHRRDPDALKSIMSCLATVQPDSSNQLSGGLDIWMSGSQPGVRVIVISTRSQQDAESELERTLAGVRWIDVSTSQARQFFQPASAPAVALAAADQKLVDRMVGS